MGTVSFHAPAELSFRGAALVSSAAGCGKAGVGEVVSLCLSESGNVFQRGSSMVVLWAAGLVSARPPGAEIRI